MGLRRPGTTLPTKHRGEPGRRAWRPGIQGDHRSPRTRTAVPWKIATSRVQRALALRADSAVTPGVSRGRRRGPSALASFLLHLSGGHLLLLALPPISGVSQKGTFSLSPKALFLELAQQLGPGAAAGSDWTGSRDTNRGLGGSASPGTASRGPGSPNPGARADRGQRWLRLGLRFQFRNVTVQT